MSDENSKSPSEKAAETFGFLFWYFSPVKLAHGALDGDGRHNCKVPAFRPTTYKAVIFPYLVCLSEGGVVRDSYSALIRKEAPGNDSVSGHRYAADNTSAPRLRRRRPSHAQH